MDRLTRKDLKTDKFAEEMFDVFEWTAGHKALVVRYGSIALAVVVVALGAYFYRGHQASVRQEALAQVLQMSDGTIGADQSLPGAFHYATQDEKDKAIAKTYAEIASKYSGTGEGAIAAMALGSEAASKGNFADAEKQYKAVVDTAPKNYAALARLALAQVYQSQGKSADAQKILQEAVSNPSDTVSKDQATIALARVMGTTNKTEALKMLDKLRTSSSVAVSGAAGQAYSDIESSGKQ